MSFSETLLLGLIAGATIVLGLPIGRLTKPAPVLRQLLSAIAVGVLVFLVWDVLSAAWEPIDGALGALHEGDGGLGKAIGYGLLMLVGVGVGLLALVGYERRLPGMELDGRKLAMMIAIGIGLHNFAEGLAIGQSAASGEIGLAVLLVIGFGLHNATEGFGIVAPLGAEGERPSWPYLLLLGLIGGGPTLLGTVIGHGFTSEPVSVVFLSLAAGSILYVVIQLIGVAARARRTDLLSVGLLIGLTAGFLTDAIVTAGGV
ncbi:ZIP family metal transporter [Nocardioides nematodiphilus]|uniref:ZIP family metal transporter n=1 Tax=Nocardioides nematodiphilus TaxID=2849669 RepID=UPI001CD91EAA|nr:ZIP family metal transporter [Nocardioides nematodiphilus]MCA1983925.1 ZIP family metal transporter [Nocardioides nematodiphilus]